MKVSNLIARIALAAITLAVLSNLAENIATQQLGLDAHIGWLLAGSLLITLALSVVVLGARRGGLELAATVFFLYFAIRYVNVFVELLNIKLGVPEHLIRNEMIRGLITSLLFAPFLVWLLGRWSSPAEPEPAALQPRSIWGWIWRVVAGDFAYIIFYMVAGMIIWPFVKDFYANFTMPSPGAILLMQVFRGLVYVAAGFGVTRLIAGKPARAALLLAIAFPVLAGLEPLIYPDPIMPAHIRFPHSIEIGWSNAAYGALLGYMLTRRAAPKEGTVVKPVASPQAA